MSNFVLAQIIGAVAVAIALFVFQINHRKRMLELSAVAAFLYSISFFLLGAFTGAAMNFIGGVRCYVFSKSRTKKANLRTFLFFAAVALIATYFTWVGPLSLLAMFGTIFSSIASSQLSTTKLRRFALLAPPLWFAYNYFTHSYPGMFIEVFVIFSNLVGQYRFDFKRAVKSRTS